MRTELRILCSNTHRTGIQVTLTHHDTTQNDEGGSTETEFLSTEQSHQDDVATALQLTIHLQTNLSAKTVLHQCLLGFRKSNFRRDTCETHTRCRAGTCTTLSTRDNDEVCLRLSHTGSDGTHTTLSYQLHGDSRLRVHILEVEDELSQILNTVDIVMRWRRNQADARDRVTGLGDDLVDLEARQLTTLTRFSTLCHLDLDFLCIYQIFCCHTESTGSHLLGLTGEADAILGRMESFVILTTFTGIASSTEGVHGECHCLVSLLREGTETHRTGNEVLDDFLYRLHLIYRDRILAETEEIADEDRLLLIVNEMCIFLEEIVIALACCELQGGDGLWVPSMLDTVLAVVELSHAWQEVELLGLECLVVQADGITGDGLESDTADGAHLCSEVALQQALAQTDALKDLGTTIASDGRDTHLSHNLEQALLHSLDVVLLGCMVILLNLSLLYQVVEDGVCQVWTEG